MIGETFDPSAEFSIRESCKPHWSQAGAVAYITLRARDSIPKEVIHRWHNERCDWLVRRGLLKPGEDDWQSVMARGDAETARAFNDQFDELRESFLDQCHGACVLRDTACAKIVSDSLLKFDGVRYRMGDFVVMPNHVHLLVVFPTEDAMTKQCTSWMHYTAHAINQYLHQQGRFWQADPFDHLVRSPDQYDHLRRYIRNNPVKAKLQAGEFRYRRGPD